MPPDNYYENKGDNMSESYPNMEKLVGCLTTEQLDVLATIEESDPDLLQEQIETGDMELFIHSCRCAKSNGEDMVEVLFGDKFGFFDFCHEVYDKIFNCMNYKVFVKIGEPIKIDITPVFYKEFKAYVKDEYGEDFKQNNIFNVLDKKKRKEMDSKLEKKLDIDIWSRKNNQNESENEEEN